MNDDLVLYETDGPVATIVLNRPEARNALNERLRAQIRKALQVAADDPDIRAIVLRGEGEAFCAGADINELKDRKLPAAAWAPDRLDTYLEGCPKPIVAALHGYTLGGGFEMSLACTLRVASNDLVAGLPEIKLGIFPGLGGTQRLTRMVGESIALSLILTGRTFGASEAERWGLVTRVVAVDELRDAAMDIAATLARRPPVALRAATDAVRFGAAMSRQDGIEFERKLFGVVCGTDDKREGVDAWLNKRQPQFRGE